MEPGANLPMLVTTLKTFYEKMGYLKLELDPLTSHIPNQV